MRSGQRAMRLYWREHLSLYIFVTVLFVTGVVFGTVMVGALTLDQRQELARHLGSFFLTVDQGSDSGGLQAFRQLFAQNIKWVLLIWLLGLSVVGLPFIFVLDFLKGVLVGFTVGFLAGQYAWKGVLFALVSVAPPNLIVLPAIVVSSVTASAFSLLLVRNRFFQKGGGVYQAFMRYCSVTIAMGVLLAGASLFESYLSPQLMKWVTPMLVSLS